MDTRKFKIMRPGFNKINNFKTFRTKILAVISIYAWGYADKSSMYKWNVVQFWTFKFHKVVRQQNSGTVEDFILPYSAVFLHSNGQHVDGRTIDQWHARHCKL